MVVELSMQYCGQILQDSYETYKTFLRCIITEFGRKVDFQNNLFWVESVEFCHVFTQKDDLKVDFAIKLSKYSFFMSEINPKEFVHNAAYSVQLPYKAGHSL